MKIYDEVLMILQGNQQARNDDWKLFEIAYTKRGMGISGWISWQDLRTLNVESYRRARQKVQQLHPELSCDDRVKMFRNKKQKQKGTFVFRENGQGELL